MKALHSLQSGRYISAGQLRSDVEAWLDDLPIIAAQDSLLEKFRRWARRHPTIVSSSLLALLMGLFVLGGYSALSRRNQAMLAEKNTELSQANQKAEEARNTAEANAQTARAQSDLALETMTFVITELRTALEGVPRESELRRQLLAASLPRLKTLGEKYLGDKSITGHRVEALTFLGSLMIQLGSSNTHGPTANVGAQTTDVSKRLTDGANQERRTNGSERIQNPSFAQTDLHDLSRFPFTSDSILNELHSTKSAKLLSNVTS